MSGNIMPQEMAVISKPWQNFKDATNCRETYLKVLPLLEFNYSLVNPVPVKSLAKALGLPAGELRRPHHSMDEAAVQRGVQIVKDLGLVEKYGYSVQ